jgi:hypothetical protein
LSSDACGFAIFVKTALNAIALTAVVAANERRVSAKRAELREGERDHNDTTSPRK